MRTISTGFLGVDVIVTVDTRGYRDTVESFTSVRPAGDEHVLPTTTEYSRPGDFVVHVHLPKDARDKADLVNTCAHEATHASRAILRHIRESHAAEEFPAYLTGHIAQGLYDIAHSA